MSDEDGARRSGRVVMARLGRIDDDTRAFDIEFWARVGAEGRFSAAWAMVAETSSMRGLDGSQPRLQRSVCRIQRR